MLTMENIKYNLENKTKAAHASLVCQLWAALHSNLKVKNDTLVSIKRFIDFGRTTTALKVKLKLSKINK
jgi:hypothetical protein